MNNMKRIQARRNWGDEIFIGCGVDRNRFIKNQILIGIEQLLNELDDPTNVQITVSPLYHKYNIESVDIRLDYFKQGE